MPGPTKLSDDWTHPFPDVAAAYRICLTVEKYFLPQQVPNLTLAEAKAREKKLINVRVLGYLLALAPTDTARQHVAKTITIDKGQGPEALVDRGGYYDQHFLRSCKFSPSTFYFEDQPRNHLVRKDKGSTPQFSHHSRPSFNLTLAEVANTIKKHPTNHSEARKSVSYSPALPPSCRTVCS